METIFEWVRHYGYAGIFSLLVLGIVGLPIPDEWLLTFAGYLVYKGNLKLIPTIASAFFGSMCGITTSYFLGRTFGLYLLRRYGYLIHVTEAKIDRAFKFLEKVEEWGLTFGYFIPGVRHLTAYVAGISKMRVAVFALFAYPGALLWTLTFISLGYYLGDRWKQMLEKIHHHIVTASIIIAVLLAGYLFIRIRKSWQK